MFAHSTKRSFSEIETFSPVGSSKHQRGENGCLELTQHGVGDGRVSLFFSLVRDLQDESLRSHLSSVLREAKSEGLPQEDAALMVADVFVTMFHTRNCRGGKGERSLFHKMLLFLYTEFPDTVITLLPLIKDFGYFKDYFVLLEMTAQDADMSYERFQRAILEIIVSHLKADADEVVRNPTAPKLSLCGKYAPRRKTRFSKVLTKWYIRS